MLKFKGKLRKAIIKYYFPKNKLHSYYLFIYPLALVCGKYSSPYYHLLNYPSLVSNFTQISLSTLVSYTRRCKSHSLI